MPSTSTWLVNLGNGVKSHAGVIDYLFSLKKQSGSKRAFSLLFGVCT
jgi:hypothetical protein